MFFVNPNKSACVDCLLLKHDGKEFQDLVSKFLKQSENLITANIKQNIRLLCSWIAKRILDYIIEPKSTETNILYRYDFNKFNETEFDKFDKNIYCPTCGIKGSDSLSKLWQVIKID